MKCLICETEAQRIPTMGDWVEMDCLECGHYRVDGKFFADMKTDHQHFDVEKSRTWLKKQRAGNIEPLIGPRQSHLVAH